MVGSRVTSFAEGVLRLLRYTLPAVTILIGLAAQANADPRIDQDTTAALTVVTHPAVVEQEGVASWYGRHWRGRKTASGRFFDERRLTAASLTLPLNTRARVTNIQNGRSIDVVVNDRGPYIAGRIMDLSQKAARILGMTHRGLANVAIAAALIPAKPVFAVQLAAFDGPI